MRPASSSLQSAQSSSCNEDGEPTWDDPISDMMQSRCVRCHEYCGSYSTIQDVVDNGELMEFTQADHHISGNDKDVLMHWLEISAPEKDCDVAGSGCGDGECTGTETCDNCQADCGVCCGDGYCDVDRGEDCELCQEDCCSTPSAKTGCSALEGVAGSAGVCLVLLMAMIRRQRR